MSIGRRRRWDRLPVDPVLREDQCPVSGVRLLVDDRHEPSVDRHDLRIAPLEIACLRIGALPDVRLAGHELPVNGADSSTILMRTARWPWVSFGS